MKCQHPYCDNEVPKYTEYKFKNGTQKVAFCCSDCGKYARQKPRHRCVGLNCHNFVTHGSNKYCSAACSNISRAKPKNIKKYRIETCIFCNCKFSYIDNGKIRKFCSTNCKTKHTRKTKESMTISEYIYEDGTRSSKYSTIRSQARTIYFENEKYICKCCGYDKHVHVCHIKAVSDFDIKTKLSVVNNLDNLIGLCPNCHWELDHLYDGNVDELLSN